MKKQIRLLAIILAFILSLGGFTSCLSAIKIAQAFNTADMTTAAVIPNVITTAPSASIDGTQESIEGTHSNNQTTANGALNPPTPTDGLFERYPYTLTEEDYEDYLDQLALCKNITLTETDEEKLNEAWQDLFTQYYYILTQCNIAYAQYCTDLSDDVFVEQYLYSSGIYADAYAEYVKVCQAIYYSEAPCKEYFFSDWSEEDIQNMLATTDEIAECMKINDDILVAYQELSDSEFEDETCRLFMQMVENNNRIASLKGYDNYIDYAYAKEFHRDYKPEQVEEIRALVKEYLIPLFLEVDSSLDSIVEKLTPAERLQINRILKTAYPELNSNLLDEYFDSLATSSADAMRALFEDENMIFCSNTEAQEGAFTGYLYDYETPFCYFGPGYQNLFTVAHELGHYYAFIDNGDMRLQMDFAELQSQGNEFMMLAFMEQKYNNTVWSALAYNQLYSTLISIIVCCIVDEFEQYVYTHKITNPEAELDKIMDQIVMHYGDGFLKDRVDFYKYWRIVVIESPVYYISYAVSGVMALDLYSIAKQDYEQAVKQYQALVEDVTEECTLQDFLEIAGLGSPFDKKTYQNIAK